MAGRKRGNYERSELKPVTSSGMVTCPSCSHNFVARADDGRPVAHYDPRVDDAAANQVWCPR